ncbi:WD repeat-containing protein 91 [Bombus pyrosoma]|uniref:WD repeat-containing protein 91 n=1 Tax=Bombus pyrosoma TaxID=396416 RepID=UPI001CB9232C|nr:WD repeat-containing protein 91 [Bombus pyrosoma]XP_043601252.1 WD repeat-containing protein 91 [Bombus pyrosoma]XP_043601253.1 WD repeat-containing protein 91 [Bombus pyrosoma]XP_043601254.1 WD repeat-containing protein 91 [Bombus pyrosoma]
MSHIQYVDELVKEYLLFRGFSQTLKAFDNDLKAEKEKGFRVDKIVDQLMQYIYNYDLASLRELWGHLDMRMFSRLESHFTPAVRKLENAVLKMYLVNAAVNNKQDRIQEFFTKMTPELQGHSEWKEWFALPFVKNPEDNPAYSVHFSRQWQDTMLVSLHNFLATIFQCMPQPTLLAIDEDTNRLKRLQEENELLKQRLSESVKIENVMDVNPGPAPQHPPLMDDFYIIAQESPLLENPKTLRNLIRNIGGGSSPILSRKPGTSIRKVVEPEVTSTKRTNTKGKIHSINKSEPVSKRSISCDSRLTSSRKRDSSIDAVAERKAKDKIDSTYILLSQEEYTEHKTSIIQCKSNASGSYVATGDADGIIKVWTPIPSPKTVTTFISAPANSNKAITALDWISKNERYFLHGDNNGLIQLHDTRDCKTLWDIQHENSRIITLLCNPTESTFVCSVSDSNEGKLLLYDIKTRKLERTLPMEQNVTALCSAFNHNGQLLITGLSNGNILIHDLRRNEIIDNISCHSSPVIDIELINDYTNICTQSEDGKLCQRSLNHSGKILWETKIKVEKNTVHGKLFTFDQSGNYMLLCTQTGGNIYKMPPGAQAKILELGGHKGTLCCDWSTANQSGTCITGGAEGKVRVSTLLSP